MPSDASTSAKLQHSAKPQPPKTTCPARPHPAQVPPNFLDNTKAAVFDPTDALGMLRAGHPHIGRVLCAVVAKRRLHNWQTPVLSKTAATPLKTCLAWPQHPVQAPPTRLFYTLEAAFKLAVAHGMPRSGHSHTSRALCAVVAKRRLHIWKTRACHKMVIPTTNHLPCPAAAPSAGSTTLTAH